MVGCIPVVIADEIEFPFENSLDWAALTIKVSELNATDVLSVLRSLPQPAIDAKRAAIDRVWRKVAWPAPSAKGDAFHEVRPIARGLLAWGCTVQGAAACGTGLTSAASCSRRSY